MITSASPAQEEARAMETILHRYRMILFQETAPAIDDVQNYKSGLSNDGTWPNIDYSDKSRAGWQPSRHLNQLRLMVLAFSMERHKLHRDSELYQAIEKALDRWLAQRYSSPSWWWSEIGVPRAMRDIVVLLGDELKGERRQSAIEVIGQHKVRGTGANLTWSAELALHHSCLVGNSEKAAAASRRIWEEIKVGAPEGIQDDWSFFQHSSRLMTFHYGKNFLDCVIKIGWQLRETTWAIPNDKRDVLSYYILNS